MILIISARNFYHRAKYIVNIVLRCAVGGGIHGMTLRQFLMWQGRTGGTARLDKRVVEAMR